MKNKALISAFPWIKRVAALKKYSYICPVLDNLAVIQKA